MLLQSTRVAKSLLTARCGRSVIFRSNSEKPKIPKNVFGGEVGDRYPVDCQTNGEIYDKKPFKMMLKAGRVYAWCLCGKSRNQPLCDGTHKDIFLKIKHKPIKFQVEETKEYWICNCKQTAHRPFCDGTHKQQSIQDTYTKV